MKRFYILMMSLVIFIMGCSNNSMKKSELEPMHESFKNNSNANVQKLDIGLKVLSKQIISNLNKQEKNKIAIVGFLNINGVEGNFEKFILEELTTQIFMTNKVEIVERNYLKKVLEEQNLLLSGVINEESAKSIGKLSGANAVCLGTTTDLGKSIRVNARIISTETGELISAASVEIIKNEEIYKLTKTMQTNYSDDNYLEDILNSKWKGYYTANQGKTNLIFEIKTDNEEILGIFDFNFQNKVRGKYILTGKYDNKIGKLDFVPKEWLNKPNGYYMVGMKGFLNIEEGKYVGNIDNSGEFSLELEKYHIKK